MPNELQFAIEFTREQIDLINKITKDLPAAEYILMSGTYSYKGDDRWEMKTLVELFDNTHNRIDTLAPLPTPCPSPCPKKKEENKD